MLTEFEDCKHPIVAVLFRRTLPQHRNELIPKVKKGIDSRVTGALLFYISCSSIPGLRKGATFPLPLDLSQQIKAGVIIVIVKPLG